MLTDKRWWAGRGPARSRRMTKSTRDERGVTIVEYALLIALIVVVSVGSLTLLGYAVSNKLVKAGDNVRDSLTALSITPSTTTGTTGDLITLTASLSDASSDAGGTISFYFTEVAGNGSPGNCTTVEVGTADNVHSNGSYLSSYTPTAAGTYWWGRVIQRGPIHERQTLQQCMPW